MPSFTFPATGRAGLPLYRRPGDVRLVPLHRLNYIAGTKRVMDLGISLLLLLVVLTWLTPLLYLLIRLDSAGPLFFVQRRTGRGGVVFRCYKFRTMRTNTECDRLQAVPGDVRITRVGRLLRASHIDELPQLLNVVLNQMSLVGPRPHMLCDDRLFATMVPGYPMRRQLKPGITGLAQAWGYHGGSTDARGIAARTRLDLFYVGKASLALDLRIMARTLLMRSVNRITNIRQHDAKQ